MKKLYMYTALALIVILGSYQLVLARPGQGNGPNQPGNGRGPISYVQALELTDDQITKIGALIQANTILCAPLEDKIQENTHKMQALEWSKDFSPENVQNLMKDMRDTTMKLQLNHEKLNLDIRFLLTPDQLQKFMEIQRGPKEGPGQGQQPPMLFGKMSALNLTDKTFAFVTKDPQGKDMTLKVIYQEGTKFIRDKQDSKPGDFKDGEEVTVAGNINLEQKTIHAMIVILGKMEPPRDPGRGPGRG